jgi:hypothetical protein
MYGIIDDAEGKMTAPVRKWTRLRCSASLDPALAHPCLQLPTVACSVSRFAETGI